MKNLNISTHDPSTGTPSLLAIARSATLGLSFPNVSDPRVFQIAALSSLALWGTFALGIDISPAHVAVAISVALLTEWIGCRLRGKKFDPRSPAISALSLCLLARTSALPVLAVAAVLAIGSKFLLRARGKHIFNPTNFAIVVLWFSTDLLWVSPGQWGRGPVLAIFCLLSGAFVIHRATRSDVTWSFLGTYAVLILARAIWLGDPLPIVWHSLQNGALLIFAFFMISDPRTTPVHRWSRLGYGALVAAVGLWIQVGLHQPNGFLCALIFTAPLVPAIDWLSSRRVSAAPWLPARRPQSLKGDRAAPWVPAIDWLSSRRVSAAPWLPARRPQSLKGDRAAPWVPAIDWLSSALLGRRERASVDIDSINNNLEIEEDAMTNASEEETLTGQGRWAAVAHRTPRKALIRTYRPSLLLVVALLASVGLVLASPGQAFCGFYVAKADTKLFNKASQVVLVRDGDRTVVTMSSDYRGDMKEFAMVIPVPTFLEREQIHVAEQSLVDHLDAYTSPRLVEYFDENPCQRERRVMKQAVMEMVAAPSARSDSELNEADFGVTIEAKYTVGEYDILILDATESKGLLSFLQRSGYKLPRGAEDVLGSYLKQGMRFFVAKVNLDEQSKLGFANLRPIQVAYESPKFMLPIRLGTVNADGAQELFVYTLTRKGRVETTNYRTVKLPTGQEIPTYVKADFGTFYKDMFDQQVKKDGMESVFMEYAWDMNWCDPCAADPLSPTQLRQLGVFWQQEGAGRGQARDVFVTRLHVRYDREHYPQDLRFQETTDRSNFQGRYVLRHAWTGGEQCAAATQYRATLNSRFEREAQALAGLTGWKIEDIRNQIPFLGAQSGPTSEKTWWQKLWPGR